MSVTCQLHVSRLTHHPPDARVLASGQVKALQILTDERRRSAGADVGVGSGSHAAGVEGGVGAQGGDDDGFELVDAP